MNIFLDCGFYAGVALRKYIDAGAIDKTWKIYALEPNRDLPINTTLEKFKDYDVTLINKAAWVKDGRVKFEISGREDSASISGTTGHTSPKTITVPCVDFSKFVGELPKAHIICSMDIEGAEFKVLEKMLVDKTIDKISILDIEFHHRLMGDRDDEDARSLIKQIVKRGVLIHLKDNLV